MISVFFPSLNDSETRALLSIGEKLDFWLNDRGRLWTSARSKNTQLAILRFLEGRPMQSPSGFSMTKDGLPNLVKEFHPHIRRGDLTAIKAVLSVLQSTRLLKGGKPIDTTTITGAWTGHIPIDLVYAIPAFCKKLKYQNGLKSDWTKYHFTTKAGPNGPAMATCLHDWRALTPNMKADICTLGGPELTREIQRFQNTDDLDPYFLDRVAHRISGKPVDPKNLKVSKVSIKMDVDCKSRLVGILDYWTQTSLVNLHKGLFDLLRQLPSDRTFNQTEGLKAFRPDEGSKYHSVDLTAATDRFPVVLQQALLDHLIGHDKAQAWTRLLTDRAFYLNGKPYFYEVGQPIGVYSSWSTFALAHHLVVFVAAQRAGKRPSWRNYILLGDDIVIGNDQVAFHYQKILDELGCGVSEGKTFRSENFFEFAKRLFHQGTEFTPFPLAGLVEVRHKYHLLYAFFEMLPERGFTVPQLNCNNLDWVADLFRISGKGARLCRSLVRNIRALAIVPKGPGVTYEQAGESFIAFSRLFGIPVSCNMRLAFLGQIFARHMQSSYS